MYSDKLASQERMERFYKGEPIDRIPFMSCATMYSGRVMGLSSKEFYDDVEKSFEAQSNVLKEICCDGNPCYDLPNGETLDLGGDLFYGNENVALPKMEAPIHSLEEAYSYELPDISKGRFLKKRIEFARYAMKKGIQGVSITAGSPFTMAGSMVDISLLLRWMRKEPSIVHKLISQAEEYLLRAADIFIEEFGADNCSVSSNYPLESNDLISVKYFDEFSAPYILDIHQKLRERGLKNFSIHLCGNHNKTIPFFRELRLQDRSFISSDEKNSLEKVAKILGHQYIYAGNVSSELLVYGSEEEVYKQSTEIIEKMKMNEGGFVLMPSCDLPINTKPENLSAMLKACRIAGKM